MKVAALISSLALTGLAVAAPLDGSAAPIQAASSRGGKVMDTYSRVAEAHSTKQRLSTKVQENAASPGFDAALPAVAQLAADVGATGAAAAGANVTSTLKFGPAAAPFQVTNNIPTVNFTVPTSWAGLLPTGSDKSRNLFFWLWGKDKTASDDLVVWLNGGPGCSSLGGFLTENGPISYQSTTQGGPKPSKDSWTKDANVVWVEQPIGTGFTEGTPTARSEDDIAADFVGFLNNFKNTFPELFGPGKRFFVTGESYAGAYVPAIMNRIYNDGNKFGLLGGYIVDGVVTDQTLQSEVVIYNFVKDPTNKKNLYFQNSDIQAIKRRSDTCGYTGYIEKYLTYPAKGKLPALNLNCQTSPWELFDQLATRRNAMYNVYRVDGSKVSPFTTSPLGDPNNPVSTPTYFDNYDLQVAIHAIKKGGAQKKWDQCAKKRVFPNGDASPPPDETYLASVIEKSKSGLIIAQGNQDALIITNGTLIGLQNLTWAGQQGFSKPPTQQFIDAYGAQSGSFVTERGLTFAQVYKSGHMIPAVSVVQSPSSLGLACSLAHTFPNALLAFDVVAGPSWRWSRFAPVAARYEEAVDAPDHLTCSCFRNPFQPSTSFLL